MMKLTALGKFADFGLLFIRLGIGGHVSVSRLSEDHGRPREVSKLGNAMQFVGVSFFPVFWGLMAGSF